MIVLGIFVTAGIFFLPALSAEQIFYVTPDGNDTFSGTAASLNAEQNSGPLGTLAEALQRVEKWRAENPAFTEPVVIELADGVYELAETLALTPSVSGNAQSPTIFRAAHDAKPVISGGRVIHGFTIGDDGRWRVTLENVKNGSWYFQQLFVNNQRRFRPRLPKNTDYSITERIATPAEEGQWRGDNQFRFSNDELCADWKNLNDVEVLAFHNWTMSRQRIKSVSPEKIVTMLGEPILVKAAVTHISGNGENEVRTVLPASPSNSPWGVYIQGNRFFVENVFEALSQPGEFYLDRKTGELTYIPREQETPDNVAVTAPCLEHLMTIAGNKDRFVENIKFKGLTFAFSNWTTPVAGNSSPQAEVSVDGAILLAGARHIDFENCGFRNLGHYALSFGTACKDCSVTKCAMKDLGAGGVRIGGDFYRTGNWPYEKTLDETLFELTKEEQVVERMEIADSVFESLGRLHPGAVGIWIGHAANNTVENCEIFDLYYSAVSVGWVWSYRESVANHNIIRRNHLHDIGQKLLSDMGAVYTLGVSPGTLVTENLIHDVDSSDYGGWGPYTDAGSNQIEMSRNIVYNTKTGSFHQSLGRENRIEYNIFVNSRERQLQRTVPDDVNSFFFEHNVVYWENDSPLLGLNWTDGKFTCDKNIYWNPKQKENIMFLEYDFQQWKSVTKQDLHSVIADPCFTNVEWHDFSFPADSPAASIGIPQPGKYGPKERSAILDGVPLVPTGFVLPK